MAFLGFTHDFYKCGKPKGTSLLTSQEKCWNCTSGHRGDVQRDWWMNPIIFYVFSPSINHPVVSPLCETIKITEITLKINGKCVKKTLWRYKRELQHVINAANGTFIIP